MITLNPITLPASKMLESMTALIGEVRFNETLQPSDIVNELVDSARVGKVEYGKGIIYNFKVALQPVKDLSETSSAFTITKPNIVQETILIDNYKFVPISLSSILANDAGLTANTISDFFAFVMSLMEDTAQFYLYDIVNALYQDWVPGQATQTIKVKQYDTTGLTGTELKAVNTLNSNEMAKVVRKTLNNMKIKNKKFTDVAKYTDANTGEQGDVVSALKSNDVKIVMNDKYLTDFMADTLASLYHSEKIGEMIPGNNFLIIPEDAMASKNSKVMCWLSDKMKFALADYYALTLSILDPSTAYENYFYHFAYGAGTFKHAPGVRFEADIIPKGK